MRGKGKDMKKSKILALLLALAMVLTCMPMMAFAEDEIPYSDITVGSRVDITFDAEGNSQFFKLDIQESGLYKMSVYQDYAASYNKYFWVGLYGNPYLNGDSLSDLIWVNYDTMETDYHIFKLNAGTYYIEAQNGDSDGTQNKLGIEFEKTDGWEISYNNIGHVGQQLWIGVYNVENDEQATIDNIVSSDKSIASVKTYTWEDNGEVKKDFDIRAKAAGTVKLTVDYTAPDGTKGQKEANIRIKKYPNQIKSLKVSGKKVSVSKNKYDYFRGKYKSTKASVKVALKKGWKISSVWAYMYTKSGKEKKVKITKKMITKGTAFKFPKKYNYMSIGFTMEKGNEWIDYYINLNR